MSGHHARAGLQPRHPAHPAIAAASGYVPLPPQIQQLARTMLQQITGPTGTHLLG
jgi:hypothetical protein